MEKRVIHVSAHRKAAPKTETVSISEEFIRLDALLKLWGAVQTGGEAKIVIQNGDVTVNGEVCLQRGRKMRSGDTAEYRGKQVAVAAKEAPCG